MKNYITDDAIRYWAKYSNSVNELGELLECTGAGRPFYNMNGRDLARIRKVLGLKKYAELSGNKLHGGRSPYAKIYKESKTDKELKKYVQKEIKKNGKIPDGVLVYYY